MALKFLLLCSLLSVASSALTADLQALQYSPSPRKSAMKKAASEKVAALHVLHQTGGRRAPEVAAPRRLAPGAGAQGEQAQATGDPHLQNVLGQRFDLMRPGRYTLLQVPKAARAGETLLLRVDADAVRIGSHCADLFFTEVNLTGTWADAKRSGGLHFSVDTAPVSQEAKWIGLGKVDLKVVHGRTKEGTGYLNFYVRHLGSTGHVVGGLLGEGDHRQAETPDPSCRHSLALLTTDSAPSASFAEASL